MNKQLQKSISALIPKGPIKEWGKCMYFNWQSKGVRFGRQNSHYTTQLGPSVLHTTTPLYRMTEGLQFYTHMYQPQPGDVVLDVGAHHGLVSLYLAPMVAPNGQVWALEPDPLNRDELVKNLQLNPEWAQHIQPDAVLLWDHTGPLTFYERGDVGSSVLYASTRAKATTRPAITLDDWVQQKGLSRVNFIKMDIEGAELEAIAGAQATLAQFQPHLAIASYHIRDGEPTYIKLEQLLSQINYPCQTLHFSNGETLTFAGPGTRKV